VHDYPLIVVLDKNLSATTEAVSVGGAGGKGAPLPLSSLLRCRKEYAPEVLSKSYAVVREDEPEVMIQALNDAMDKLGEELRCSRQR